MQHVDTTTTMVNMNKINLHNLHIEIATSPSYLILTAPCYQVFIHHENIRYKLTLI